MKKEIIENTRLNEFFGDKFEFINNGFAAGQFNMDFDYSRTQAFSNGEALPMFRLYGWDPWSVSLGYNQKETDILKERTDERGFDIVRRPTGGRAVLHAGEITYSVVLTLPEHKTVHDMYREIHIVLLKGLQKIGGEVIGFEKSQPDFREMYKRQGLSVSCFASSARYEIEWEGKKIVGSAQRLFGDTLLQHGSILLGDGHEQLAQVASVDSEERRQMLMDYTKKHSATMKEVCGRAVTFDEAADAIYKTIFE